MSSAREFDQSHNGTTRRAVPSRDTQRRCQTGTPAIVAAPRTPDPSPGIWVLPGGIFAFGFPPPSRAPKI
jgi:ADP-ribose pyrophosphatase YjhB (NUDIX family)